MEGSPFDAAGDAAGIGVLDSLPMPSNGSKKERVMTEEEIAKKVSAFTPRANPCHCRGP